MILATRLRNHLHQWLHPRDPLLEAWKDDPFVEWLDDRSGRNQPVTARSLVSDLMPNAGVIFYLTLVVIYFYLNHHYPGRPSNYAVFAAIVLLLSWKGIMKWIVADEARVVTDIKPINLELELWTCGMRGRDMAKKYVAERAPESAWPIFITGLTMLLVPSYIYLSWFTWESGFEVLICYALLLTWAGILLRWILFSIRNPFRTMDGSFPKYLSSLHAVHEVRYLIQSACAIVSCLIVIGCTIALWMDTPSITGGRTSLPYPVQQITALFMATLIAYCSPIQDATSLLKELENRFDRVDHDFDLHVRTRILQDPDADRQS